MSIPQGSPLLESGCKSTRFSDILQIYSTVFLKYFERYMLTSWIITMLQNIFFQQREKRTMEARERIHYYIHACVCVCAKGKKKEAGRRIHTEVFHTFLYHLSPEAISVPVHRGLRHGDRLPATYHHTCHLSPAYHPTEDDEGEQ